MYYFDSTEKQKQLKKTLDAWIGTPFRHHCGVKKLGCDCPHFVALVLEEVGILTWHKNLIPDYGKDWPSHHTRELFAERLIENTKAEKVKFSGLKNGDVLLFHSGRATAHGGIYFEDYVYQALEKVGICRIRFTDKFLKRHIKVAYRLMPK